MVVIDDFIVLYNDYLSGKVVIDIGLFVGKWWWVGDSLLKGLIFYW